MFQKSQFSPALTLAAQTHLSDVGICQLSFWVLARLHAAEKDEVANVLEVAQRVVEKHNVHDAKMLIELYAESDEVEQKLKEFYNDGG